MSQGAQAPATVHEKDQDELVQTHPSGQKDSSLKVEEQRSTVGSSPALTSAAESPPPYQESGSANSKTAPSEKDLLDEHSRRKREREGSLEPSLSRPDTVPGNIETLPTKKNRLQIPEGQPINEDAASASPELESVNPDDHSDSGNKPSEGEKVGHIRKRVEDLTWKEAQKLDESEQNDDSLHPDQDLPKEAKETKDASRKETPDKGPPQATEVGCVKPPAVRTQPTFSSFSSRSSPFSSVPTSSGSRSSSVFSKTALAEGSKSTLDQSPGPAKPSWLVSVGTNLAAPGGGIKPSPLGTTNVSDATEASGSPGESSSSTPVTHSASAFSAKAKPALGFGAFAGASPLSKGSSSPKPVISSSSESQGGDNDEKPAFLDVLAAKSEELAEEVPKKFLESKEGDLTTGEENERTVHSSRAKLYTMAEDQSWKERGTGTIRCNVPKSLISEKKSARLVMRADGVLRVILNVPLFAGMKCELAQDRFVRIVTLEEGKLVHFAIKLGNPGAAAAFYQALQDTIPSAESTK
ncbi:hypothetical protein IE53DRAFT_246843 [Violaceomyces palustris]|uniref:Uncharacterized protein n=1 Tax=Violaceomyces palustris TaxID=1673888 RepID=A0ACD0P4C1_9BASI|nr:hypothetical protein IE53DRAFT_246843 [Violaceomyces palustris]